ncbi:hypothetical protein RRG08_005987 [Elysia crispata]|uniref:Uncharacterized protein n=1 Tax=Elysia crispata TaxID=231223 RepID=A0AAE0XUV1_9GAST|nr:hypothetical protein RRG08_005987 [Elysia crispata]
MKFKPKKSRSLSKVRIDAMTTFTAANQQIPTVSQEPVKSLGRWNDSSMKDNKTKKDNRKSDLGVARPS